MADQDAILSKLQESRRFQPPADFARSAHVRARAEYDELYARARANPEAFWAEIAGGLHWFRPWTRVLEWRSPQARWFVDAQTNVSFNCLDAQIEAGRGDHTAILFEGEPGDVARLTFRELRAEVCRFAAALRQLGVRKGDRVTIYMPMVPQLAVAMLACSRIGAVHSVIFGGFSVQAIVDRVEDAQSDIVITADGGWRRGKVIPLKATVDQAAERCPRIRTVVVYERLGRSSPAAAEAQLTMKPSRDHWWSDVVANMPDDFPAEPCDAEDMLFLLYTSGSTGKPKGIIHTTGGYMVHAAYTARMVFDLQPDDVYWCTADCGWITGHSYVVYGILANGVTTLMYEGAPNFPDWDRFWSMIAKHRVTKFYTAPTVIRSFMREGRAHADKHDLSSLKLLGTVGEPINPEAWIWYHEVIGRGRCPIVDTWWQTETGGIMIAPLPGAIPTKPGSATLPLPGIDAAILNTSGEEQPADAGGLLCIRRPWPGMLRGIWGDAERFQRQYWNDVPGIYFAGDSARRDADGYFWIMGRMDDVLKVAGHRLGTMEIESALVSHPCVAEAAVVGVPHEIKGNAIAAFVTLRNGEAATSDLRDALAAHVATQLGAVARPDQLRFAQALPKTRSGKIMRRLLKEVATSGAVRGDTTTLEDFTVLEKLAQAEDP